MNFLEKYNKYKLKFFIQTGGRKVRVISNSGAREGMTNQCLFISILDYLSRNGHPDLTLRELRSYAGLDVSSENTMFDIIQPRYREAINRICVLYNLSISFLPVNASGVVLYGANIIDIRGNGGINIEIAQYGAYHFELIVGDEADGDDFVPAYVIKNNITKKIDPALKIKYDDLIESEGLLKIMENTLIEHEHASDLIRKNIEIINSSGEYNLQEKESFLKLHANELADLIRYIDTIKERINRLKEHIKSLHLIIDELVK
jgi:hypothetical protein